MRRRRPRRGVLLPLRCPQILAFRYPSLMSFKLSIESKIAERNRGDKRAIEGQRGVNSVSLVAVKIIAWPRSTFSIFAAEALRTLISRKPALPVVQKISFAAASAKKE